MSLQEFLKTQVPFLRGLSDEHLAVISEQVEELTFKKGQTILFKGASVDGLHIVAAGTVSVLIKPEKGKALIQVAELGVGEIFGETSIIEYKMAGATIRANADVTKIYVVSQAPFLEILKTDEDLKTRIIDLIRDRQADRQKDNEQVKEAAAANPQPAASETPGGAADPPPPAGDGPAPA